MQDFDTDPVIAGALEARPGPDGSSWLSPRGAQYAVDRLWALVSGGAAYAGPPLVTFRLAPRAAAEALRAQAPATLERVPLREVLPPAATLDLDAAWLPVLFRTSPSAPAAGGTRLDFPIDLVSTTYFMLTRWEEIDSAVLDRRGRFTAESSLAYRQGFLDRPIVDEWALVLRAWVEQLAGTWRARRTAFTLAPSHDVDSPRRFQSLGDVVQAAAAVLTRERSVPAAAREVTTGVRSRIDWRADPFYQGALNLMDISERYGLRSTFFFKTADPGPNDEGHSLTVEPAPTIVAQVRDRGHEIGFHPGFTTYDDEGKMLLEKRRFEAATSMTSVGSRQHNLRFKVPNTWRHLIAAGIVYDATMGYADHPGFRCGTCHEFPVYDARADEPLPIRERPLVVMEGTLLAKKYEGRTADDALDVIRALGRRCRRVGGTMTFLWHNSSFRGSYRHAAHIYEAAIAEMSGWRA